MLTCGCLAAIVAGVRAPRDDETCLRRQGTRQVARRGKWQHCDLGTPFIFVVHVSQYSSATRSQRPMIVIETIG